MADIYGIVEHSVLYYTIIYYTILCFTNMEVHDSTQEQRKKTKTKKQYFLPVFRYFFEPVV